MEPCIRCGKADTIISERLPICHDCMAKGTAPPEKKTLDSSVPGGTAAPPAIVRPPRAARAVVCRGCFNRCALLPGEQGVCTVKRNIAGRITGTRLRIKGIFHGA